MLSQNVEFTEKRNNGKVFFMQLPLKINGWVGFVLKFRAISEFYIGWSLKKPPQRGLSGGS